MHIGQLLEHEGVVGRCVAVGDLDMAPALQRCEQHEQGGHPIALILVVVLVVVTRLLLPFL